MTMKHCPRCGCDKPATLEYWHRSKQTSDGWFNYCKECKRNYALRYSGEDCPYPLHEKKCSNCNKIYPATTNYFYSSSRAHSGLNSYCIDCQLRRQKAVEYDNKLAQKRMRDKYKDRNKDHNPYTEEDKLKTCIDCRQILPVSSFYRANNRPDGLTSVCKDCANARSSKWQSNNPGKTKKATERWKKRNPQRAQQLAKIAMARREARKQSLSNNYSTVDWQRALDYFHGCCAVCGRQLKDLFGTHTVATDHWIPLSNPSCPGTVATNIIPLCHGEGGCNNKKHDKLPEQWLVEEFGKRKAKQILSRIKTYFEWVRQQDESKSA